MNRAILIKVNMDCGIKKIRNFHDAYEIDWWQNKKNCSEYGKILSLAFKSFCLHELLLFQLDGENDFVANLIFSKVTEDNFQMYKITVSNDFGSNSTIISFSKSGELQPRHEPLTVFSCSIMTSSWIWNPQHFFKARLIDR